MTTNWSGQGTANTQPGSVQAVNIDAIWYVNKVDTSGWLRVLSDAGKDEYLYKYTKVMQIGRKAGRTYFKILDGHSNGITASMKDANAAEYLGKIAPKKKAAMLTVTYGKYDDNWISLPRGGQTLKQQFATVTINGVSANATMNSVWKEDPEWSNYYPIEAGAYDILLPDAPHKKGATSFYRKAEPKLVNDQVWFPIKFGDNSRFVHVGHLSDGCTTITDIDKWAAIHEELISHRAKDGVSVGKMIVSGTPKRVS
jgi:hypothetical protein